MTSKGFDFRKLTDLSTPEAQKLAAQERDNGKRSPSSRLLPPVQLNDKTPEPVAATLVVKRLMEDQFVTAITNALLKSKTSQEVSQRLRNYLLSGQLP